MREGNAGAIKAVKNMGLMVITIINFWTISAAAEHSANFFLKNSSTDHLQVFVFTGQSNSLGTTAGSSDKDISPGQDAFDALIPFFWSNRSALPSHSPSVLYGDSGGKIVSLRPQQGDSKNHLFWGPEIGFARRLAASGLTNIFIVKASRGGGGNTFWLKHASDDHMYQHLVQTVSKALAALPKGTNFKIAALIYIQGESDSGDEALASGDRLRKLAQNLRHDLPHAESLKVLVGGIAASGPNRDIVRTQQSSLPSRDPTFTYVTTLDLLPHLYDGLHFDQSAKLKIGSRLADAWLADTR